MKIRTKFALFTSGLVLTATVALALTAYVQQRRLVLENVATARQEQSAAFATVCRQALAGENELFMMNYAKLLSETPGIAYAYFHGPDGKILVHSDKLLIHQKTAAWNSVRPTGTVDESVPITIGDRQMGAAVVGFSEAFGRERLAAALRRTLVQVSMAAALVGLLGLAAAFLFAYLLTSSLSDLARGSEEIAQGNFKTEVAVRGGDEVGDLAARFNSMAKNLSILDEMKDEFISSVSHDLRNPMAAVKMYGDYMLHMDPDRDKILPSHRNMLTIMVDSAARLNIFVTNILDAAKMKAGVMAYHPDAVDLIDAAQNVQRLFGLVAKKRHIALMAEIPPKLPKIWADPERFDQVITNLVSNALKYTQDGGQIVLGGAEQGDNIVVYVADTGKGIPAQDLPTIFDRFVQSGAAEQRQKRIQGTGLGLYIVKKTVVGMGGTIEVESQLGRGSRFTVTLPKAVTVPKAAKDGTVRKKSA